MFKGIISPFQKILLKRRLCVGCTQPLDKGIKLGEIRSGRDLISCKCKRRYILDRVTNSYRRASLEEEALFLNGKKG